MTEKKDVLANLKKSSIDGKEITDSLGRKIVLRKPLMTDKLHIASALKDDSMNIGVRQLSDMTIYVATIDGTIFPTPKTYPEIQAGLNRLGEEGYIAVLNAVFSDEQSAGENKEEIKK